MQVESGFHPTQTHLSKWRAILFVSISRSLHKILAHPRPNPERQRTKTHKDGQVLLFLGFSIVSLSLARSLLL